MPRFKNISFDKLQKLLGPALAMKLLTGVGAGLGGKLTGEYLRDMEDTFPAVRTSLFYFVHPHEEYIGNALDIKFEVVWAGERAEFTIHMSTEERGIVLTERYDAVRMQFVEHCLTGLVYLILGYIPKAVRQDTLAWVIFEQDRGI